MAELHCRHDGDGIVNLSREEYDIVDYQGALAINETYRPSSDISACTRSDTRNTIDGHGFVKSALEKEWDLNCKEAAIFIQEGQENISFSEHPNTILALKVYDVSHMRWFNCISIFASIGLLLLAIIEEPSPFKSVPYWVPVLLEMVLLLVMALKISLDFILVGLKRYTHHIRSMMKTTVLVILLVWAVVTAIRGSTMHSYGRALRPIFLLDFMPEVRRFLRLILQSLKVMLHMFGLIFYIMVLYALIGFYIFHGVANKDYGTFGSSLLSQFIITLKPGWEDIFGRAYFTIPWTSTIFFISYMLIQSSLIVKVFLAVITSAFEASGKSKFRSIFLHRRNGANHAFKLLVSKQNPNTISKTRFISFWKYIKPKSGDLVPLLSFKALNKSMTGAISKEEFYSIYDTLSIHWEYEKNPSLKRSSPKVPELMKRIHLCFKKIVKNKAFLYVIAVLIAIDFLFLLLLSLLYSYTHETSTINKWLQQHGVMKIIRISTLFFTSIYTIEVLLKIIGLGPKKYFTSIWRWFDFVITISSLVTSAFHGDFLPNIYVIILLRPLKGLRIFKTIRDIFGTLRTIAERLFSSIITLLLIYYFFAIIGMGIFSDIHSADIYNKTNGANETDIPCTVKGPANFRNIFWSYLTLFIISMGPGWQRIMFRYSKATSPWSVLFFVIFMMTMMVVLTVIMAFIIQAFLFHIRLIEKFKQDGVETNGDLSQNKVTTTVTLKKEEIGSYLRQQGLASDKEENIVAGHENVETIIQGTRQLTNTDLKSIFYAQSIPNWIDGSETVGKGHHDTSHVHLEF